MRLQLKSLEEKKNGLAKGAVNSHLECGRGAQCLADHDDTERVNQNGLKWIDKPDSVMAGKAATAIIHLVP
jgi:hypothetical protein